MEHRFAGGCRPTGNWDKRFLVLAQLARHDWQIPRTRGQQVRSDRLRDRRSDRNHAQSSFWDSTDASKEPRTFRKAISIPRRGRLNPSVMRMTDASRAHREKLGPHKRTERSCARHDHGSGYRRDP